MPAVASVPKELYLSSSLKDLNKKTEVKPEKTSTKNYVHSAQKIFKAAEECRLDRDEERAYVLYMKYVAVYNLIKKRPDFKQQQDYYHSILGPANIKKAIEEAERLSESLKLRVSLFNSPDYPCFIDQADLCLTAGIKRVHHYCPAENLFLKERLKNVFVVV